MDGEFYVGYAKLERWCLSVWSFGEVIENMFIEPTDVQKQELFKKTEKAIHKRIDKKSFSS